jgi:hypothetical protein
MDALPSPIMAVSGYADWRNEQEYVWRPIRNQTSTQRNGRGEARFQVYELSI